jgi:hypothetical protein
LGQIEDASFRLAGARFAGRLLAVLPFSGAVVGPDDLPVEFRVELMSGVVTQIDWREKMND